MSLEIQNELEVWTSHDTDGCCCGQLWVRHMICGQTCDRLYHFTFLIDRLGIPLGYSEIDHIHLSSEAQCVSHHLPPVDCHSCKMYYIVAFPSDFPAHFSSYTLINVNEL